MVDVQTYRDSRAKATDASEAVRKAMASLGIPESIWGTIRPVVTHKGSSYVHLGVVRADAAKTMAEAMRPG
ncbi:hypothetical protein [Streptomyces sp. NPDC058255]|uniref:hypothetical protein n=1 Tax=Streptomyces sp. NPDC058255 TaxID=3346407 RepID=UPI0036EC2E5D